MRNEEMLKNMINENFVEVSRENQEKINGGFTPAYLGVAYGVGAFIPSVISRKKK